MGFLVEATHLALYLKHLGETRASKSAVEEAVNGLAWAHSMAGITSTTNSPFIGLKRAFAKPVCKKSPFTVEMLQTIVRDAKKTNTLTSLCLAALCLMSFAGFLRFDELANIWPCDLEIREDHLTIQIPCSKTDQLSQVNEVVVAKTGSKTCPMALLVTYIQRVQMDSDQKLFRPIFSGRCEKLRETGGITYSRMRELLKKLDELGFPPADFNLHSLTAGGALAAAAADVPDRVFKKHGPRQQRMGMLRTHSTRGCQLHRIRDYRCIL